MSGDDVMRGSVDRALSASTRPKAGTGAKGPTADTIRKYWEAWRKVEEWRSARRVELPDGRVVAPAVMPMSSETLAEYLAHLAAQGLAKASLTRARAAIRWRHREQGHPVPDGLPALGVLRDHETSLENAGLGERHTVPMPLADLVQLVERSCDRGVPQGMRDAAMLLLTFTAKLGREDLHALNIGDFRAVGGTDGELEVRVARRGRWVRVPHWLAHDGKHATVCPVEAVWQWLLWLRGRGALPDSPFLRPVDAVHRLGGVDVLRMGKTPEAGRLTRNGCRKILVAALRRAQMHELGYDLRSLRKGGAEADRVAGAAQAAIAEQGGWQVTTPTFVQAMTHAEAGRRHTRTGAHRLPAPVEPAGVQPSLFDTFDGE